MRCCISILALLALGVLALVGLGAWAFNAAASSPRLLNEYLSFDNPVVIPPILEPIEQNGRKVYDLTLQVGEVEILPGLETPPGALMVPSWAPPSAPAKAMKWLSV
jgi:hypothetical protein